MLRLKTPFLALLALIGAIHAVAQSPNAPAPQSPGLRAQPPTPPAAPPRSLLFGAQAVWGENGSDIHWDRDGGARARQMVARMKEAGVTNLRVAVSWSEIERARGQYAWNSTDRLLRFLQKQGFLLTGVVSGAPDWANATDEATRKLFADRNVASLVAFAPPTPDHYPDLARFATALGQRFKGVVRRWEFWSRPDSTGMPQVVRDAEGRPLEIRFGGDPATYARMLRVFAANIRRADPAALVAVGGLEVPGIEFLQGLYAAGAQKAPDGQPLPFDWIDACYALMRARQDGSKKLWVTEWGWETYPGSPNGILEGEQARWIRQSLAEMRRRPFIEQANFRAFADWRARANDPLSLVSAGLCAADLRPKPGYARFRAEALALPSPPETTVRAGLIATPPPALLSEAAHLEVDAAETLGAMPRIWRGVAPNLADAGRLPAAWNEFGPRLNAAGAPFIRINPFSPDNLTVTEEGTLNLRWEEPDQLLQTLAKAGANVILMLTPPPTVTPEAWQNFLRSALERYGKDANFGVTRWELGVPSEWVKTWYGPFAQTARAALPSAPVGLHVLAGEPAMAAAHLVEICAQSNAPCDSFSWRVLGSPLEAAQTTWEVRAIFARSAAMKRTALLPELRGEAQRETASQLLALTSRALDYAPLREENPLLGVLAALPALVTEEGRPTGAWTTMQMLNRLAGSRLPTRSDDSGVRCLATRSGNAIVIVIWREADTLDRGEQLTLVRLRNLPAEWKRRLRLTRYDVGTAASFGEEPKPRAIADLHGNGLAWELPLLLAPRAATLIELRPAPASALQAALTSPRFTWYGGDELELTLTLRNTSTKPLPAIAQISSSVPRLVSPSLERADLGTIPPESARALRYRFRAPTVGRDTAAQFQIRVGNDCQTALAVLLSASLTARLDTPRLDLDRPNGKAVARVRLSNRSNAPLGVQISADGGPPVGASLPMGGKSVVKNLELTAPSENPGYYPVEIAIRDSFGTTTGLRAEVGVPVLCRYATVTPTIDGNLREWTDAAPMGMGRAEQVHEKSWGGPNDLSAIAYTKWDDQFFYFACAVTDNAHYVPRSAADLTQADSVQFAISVNRNGSSEKVGYGPGDMEFGLALVNGAQPTLYRLTPPTGVANGLCVIRREGDKLYYEAAIPWKELAPARPAPEAVFGFSVLVNDCDGRGTGYIEWGGGIGGAKRPGQFPPLRLVK
jgi:hypothetical protein